MSLGEIRLQASQGPAPGRTGNWRLHQELQATVIRGGGPGLSQLRIGGRDYVAGSGQALPAGRRLRLRVVALQPQVVLAPVTEQEATDPASLRPATILAPDLLSKTRSTAPGSDSKLLNLLKIIGITRGGSLTPECQRLLQQVRTSGIASEAMQNPAALRAALLDSGLLLESRRLAGARRAPTAPGDLKGVLLQLFSQLCAQPALLRRPPAAHAFCGDFTDYLLDAEGADPGVASGRLLQAVEEALHALTRRQQRSLSESGAHRQCWHFELPVQFADSVQTLALTLYRDAPATVLPGEESRCGAEFNLQLQQAGRINVQIEVIGTEVVVTLSAEHRHSMRQLGDNRERLRQGLQRRGLSLGGFSCGPVPAETHRHV